WRADRRPRLQDARRAVRRREGHLRQVHPDLCRLLHHRRGDLPCREADQSLPAEGGGEAGAAAAPGAAAGGDPRPAEAPEREGPGAARLKSPATTKARRDGSMCLRSAALTSAAVSDASFASSARSQAKVRRANE